jgi:hypothetical protein
MLVMSLHLVSYRQLSRTDAHGLLQASFEHIF